MRKIASDRNYALSKYAQTGIPTYDAMTAGVSAISKALREFKQRSGSNPSPSIEEAVAEVRSLQHRAEYYDRAQAVIKGLKAFIEDKGLDLNAGRPSGGWHNYQPGSTTPNTSDNS